MITTSQQPVVCQVLHTLNVGGAELLARQFAEHNQPLFRPVFACLDELGSMGGELRHAGFVVEVLGRKSGFDLGCARRMKQFLRRERVRLVHAHQYAPFFYTSAARWLGHSCPILFTEHGRDYPDYRRWKRVWANKLLLHRKDRVVGVGKCVKQALIANEGIASDRIEVIYNGVDTKRYGPRPELRAEVRRELGLADNETAIIQVARLNRLKDHATSVRAVHRLAQCGNPARLLLAGEGEEQPALEQLIHELGAEDHVTLLGLRDDVPRLLQAADVFLLSSVTEGIPLTMIEAMLTGLPCVSTNVGGIGEVVVEGETGLLAEAGDVPGLATALQSLVERPPLAKQMGSTGRARALKMFDDRAMHSAYRRVYCELTGLDAASLAKFDAPDDLSDAAHIHRPTGPTSPC